MKLYYLLLLFFPFASFCQSIKIGTIDLDTLWSHFPEKKQVDSIFAIHISKYENEVKKLQEQAQILYMKIMKDAQTSRPPSHSEEDSLIKYQNRLMRFSDLFYTFVENVDKKTTEYLKERIAKITKVFAEENQYSLILYKEDCIFSNQNMDVAYEIIPYLAERNFLEIIKNIHEIESIIEYHAGILYQEMGKQY